MLPSVVGAPDLVTSSLPVQQAPPPHFGLSGGTRASRDYYSGFYYDNAERPIASVNVGTDGGSVWSMPTSVPSRSSTVLVTGYGYLADNVQQVTITGAPTGGTFTLTFNGHTTTSIAYNAAGLGVESALQALSSVGTNNVLVMGPAGGPYLIEFGGTLGGSLQPAITFTSALSGGSSPNLVVVTPQPGGDAGHQQTITDPRGIITQSDIDLLGRTTRSIANFVPGGLVSAPTNQSTDQAYDANGDVLLMTADQASGVSQQTAYLYGVGGTAGTNLFSNDLIAKTEYPDKTTGVASTSAANDQTLGYNFLGEKTGFTDQNGTTHGYTLDVLGRLTADIVTAFGSGVDQTIKRLGYSFETGGRPYQQTSFTNTGGTSILNQVQDAYNGYGQLVDEYQSHVGAVNTSTTPKVVYGFAQPTAANYSRPSSMTYPNGRVVSDNYNTGIDATISRLSGMSDTGGNIESYWYLGLGTIVRKVRPHSILTYVKGSGAGNGDAGDQYTGLDRFGRVVDQNWVTADTINGGTGGDTLGTSTDNFGYGYDQDSNVLYRSNIVNTSFGELYHTNGSSNGYDGLNRLTNFERGTLNSTFDTITGTPSTTNAWALDALGNPTGTGGATQTFNAQDQITAITGKTSPVYDNNGNMKTDESGHTYTFDAWNRMIEAQVGSTLEFYSYDADNRRPGLSICSGAVSDSYYSSGWQDIEDDVVPCVGTTTKSTYVWSESYVDDLVARDQSTNGGVVTRVYAQQDANHDTTSLVNASGTVLERFVYDPYGARIVLTASTWATTTDSQSWVYGFQGGRLDPLTNKINFRNRDLDTGTDTWMEKDPAPYVDGPDPYQFLRSNPAMGTDPLGLFGMDLAFNAFIPLSDGKSAFDGHDFNWFPALFPWSFLNYFENSRLRTWTWFETDNREDPGDKGTSRIHTDVTFDSIDIGKLQKNKNVTLNVGSDLT
jgi:RHS repeat-associated protein